MMSTLAKRLRYAREQANLSQSALARQVGIKPQAIQFMEAGQVRRPRNLLEIAQVLSVSPEWLLLGKGRMEFLNIEEPQARYDPQGAGVGLSPEALKLAQMWMELPKPQRIAILEMIRSLGNRQK